MPIYEYQCDKCGEIFEVLQKHSDPPPKSHSCGSRKVHRVMSRSSFILKGTGWYITDYGRKDQGGESAKAKKKNGAEKAGGAEASGTRDTSTPKSSAPPAKSV